RTSGPGGLRTFMGLFRSLGVFSRSYCAESRFLVELGLCTLMEFGLLFFDLLDCPLTQDGSKDATYWSEEESEYETLGRVPALNSGDPQAVTSEGQPDDDEHDRHLCPRRDNRRSIRWRYAQWFREGLIEPGPLLSTAIRVPLLSQNFSNHWLPP